MENTSEIIHLKFPIGDFIKKDEYTPDEIASLAEVIETHLLLTKGLLKPYQLTICQKPTDLEAAIYSNVCMAS